MHAVRLDSKTMEDYIRKIKIYVDELVSVNIPGRHEEHADAILEGLPSSLL